MAASVTNNAGAILKALECEREGRCECHASLRRGRGATHCPAHLDRNHPSLSVSQENGRVLVNCKTGCSQSEVIAALMKRDLWTPREADSESTSNGHSGIVATYAYRDELGEVLHETVRYFPKAFRQRRPDGRGGYEWSLKGLPRLVVYCLPELVAADPATLVFVVESEKSVDRLHALGLVATCSPMGAGKWRREYTEHFRGRDVVIVPDNDEPGSQHAADVARSLDGVAQRVRVTRLPGLAEKEDIYDWLEVHGHSAQELLDLVEHAPEPERPPRRFRFLSSDELKNRPDPEWLVEDVLQRDTLALIVGQQETFKSFIAVDMAMSTGTGRGWHGHQVQQAVVAYVSAEGGSGLGIRVEAWKTVKGSEQDRCFFLADQAPQFLDRKIGGDVDELLLSIADLPEPPGLFVIDTAARVMVGGDENSAQDMGLFIDAAEKIRQATHATVLIVHHNNKQGGARGSTALLGAVHTIIECSREKNSQHVLVQCGKQKDAQHFAPLMLEARVVELGEHPETGRTRSSLILETRPSLVLNTLYGTTPKLSAPTQEALTALVGLGTGPVGFGAWLEAANQAKSSFHRARKELVDGGYVEHQADGRYQVTEKGKVQGPGGSKQGPLDLGPSANGSGSGGPPPVRGGPGPSSPDPDSYEAWTERQDLPL